MQPRDLRIWNFLKEHYPALPEEILISACRLLEDSEIPIEDKIYPWIVEAVLTRVQLGLARQEIRELREEIQILPNRTGDQVSSSLVQGMVQPQASFVRLEQVALELTGMLQRAAIVEANLSTAGWRGIGAAIGAIFRVQALAIVVGVIALVSAGIGGVMVWNMTEADRRVLEFNREVIERCHRDYAADEDLNGWYTCPKFQVPMPEQVDGAE